MYFTYYRQSRERVFCILITFLFFIATFFVNFSSTYAEGSKSWNSSNSGARVYTIGVNSNNNYGTTQDELFYNILSTNQKYIYVYAKAGETINIGTSYTEKSTDVRVISPANVTTNYNVTKTSVGYIANYQQERNGPNTVCTSGTCANYYNPIKISVTSATEGLYKIAFYSSDFATTNPDTSIAATTNENVTAAFYSWHGTIAAFDVTVTNSSKVAIPGRAFGYEFRVANSTNTYAHSYDMALYALTDDGVYYRIRFPDVQGGSYYLISNKKGLVSPSTGKPLYHSVRQLSDAGKYSLTNKDLNRLFFNKPDADLLSYLGLTNVKTFPSISDFRFTGDYDSITQVGRGGTFSFSSSAAVGYFQIIIKSGSTVLATLQNDIYNGTNSISWNGKNSSGTNVAAGTYTSEMHIFVGENHFIFFDIEGNDGGIRVARGNGSSSDRNDLIYYDNSQKTNSDGVSFVAVLDSTDRSSFGSGGNSTATTLLNWTHPSGQQIFLDFWTNLRSTTSYQGSIRILDQTYKNITVTKTWSDYDNKFGTRPSSIRFDAYIGNKSAGNCTANASSSWKCTISSLPVMLDSGYSYITYTVSEAAVSGYTASASSVTVNNTGTTAAFTNTLQTKNVTVTKSWSDQDNKFSTRPSSIIFDAFIGSGTTSVGNCTANASGSWKCTISNLANLNSSGSAISYTIKERTTPSGYTGNTASTTGTTATITNTLQTKNIAVTKAWSDQNNKFSTRPTSIIFDAYIGSGTTSVGNCTANASGSWKCTISNLASLNSSGAAISYTIKERTIPSGYTGNTASTTGTTATITNTLQTKNIAVTKAWSDQNNKFSTRPTSIIFDAYIGSGTTSVGNCTANASGSWKCTISNLAKLTSTGTAVSYTIKERTVPSGYTATTASVTTEAATTATVTNTLQTKNVVVTKVWSDQNNKFDTRPDSIIFDAFIGSGTTSVGNCTANASGSWKCTISNLAKLTSTGAAVSYTIKERTVPSGYTQQTGSVTTEAGTTATVTNTLQTKDVTVTKAWSDQNNKFNTRPASIIFDAFIGNGTTSVGNCTANASGAWKCTISNLAKLTSTGAAVSYTIKERTVPSGYTQQTGSVTTEAATTATVTNTLQTKNVVVTKAWSDQDNKFDTRPASIIFDAFIGSDTTSVGNCTANASGSWKCTISNLAKVNSSGTAISYTIKERTVPSGYTGTTAAVTTEAGTTATVTNTLQTMNLKVKKIWQDDNNNDGYRTLTICLEVMKDGNPTGIRQELSGPDNVWYYTFQDIPSLEGYSVAETGVNCQ